MWIVCGDAFDPVLPDESVPICNTICNTSFIFFNYSPSLSDHGILPIAERHVALSNASSVLRVWVDQDSATTLLVA